MTGKEADRTELKLDLGIPSKRVTWRQKLSDKYPRDNVRGGGVVFAAMKHLFCISCMLSLGLGLVVGSTACAQDIDELIAIETQGGVTELLDEIRNRDVTLAAKDKEIAELRALLEDAFANGDAGFSIAEALALRDEARSKLEVVSRSMNSRICELEKSQATLQSDSIAKAVEVANLKVELGNAQESTRQDRLTLAYNLACIYKAGKQYTKAEVEFMKALELGPDDPGVHYNLGILYDDNLGNAKKALYHYQRFLDLAPHDKDAPNVIEWMSSLQ